MSSPAGPEDRTPRHAGDGDAAVHQDARIHDARQDAAPSGPHPAPTTPASSPRAPPPRRRRRRPGATDAGPRTEPTRSQPVTAVRHDGTGRDNVDGRDTVVDEVPTRETVVAREKEQFGGIKIGSAFFGWLAATGMAVLLTALVAAAGTAVGLATNTDVNAAVNSGDQTVGLVGIIVLLVILFVSYYSGGYVAGRMARFNGAKQGFMVWVWALIAAVVVAVLGLVAGQQFNILANLNSFPRIPVNEGELTTTSIIAAVVVAVVALVGAVLGGTGRHALPPQGGPGRLHARGRLTRNASAPGCQRCSGRTDVLAVTTRQVVPAAVRPARKRLVSWWTPRSPSCRKCALNSTVPSVSSGPPRAGGHDVQPPPLHVRVQLQVPPGPGVRVPGPQQVVRRPAARRRCTGSASAAPPSALPPRLRGTGRSSRAYCSPDRHGQLPWKRAVRLVIGSGTGGCWGRHSCPFGCRTTSAAAPSDYRRAARRRRRQRTTALTRLAKTPDALRARKKVRMVKGLLPAALGGTRRGKASKER